MSPFETYIIFVATELAPFKISSCTLDDSKVYPTTVQCIWIAEICFVKLAFIHLMEYVARAASFRRLQIAIPVQPTFHSLIE